MNDIDRIDHQIERLINETVLAIASLHEMTEKRLSSIERALSIIPVDPEEEVYINSTEVQRLLRVSAPVVSHWVRDGLLSIKASKVDVSNRYLLSEVFWLKRQNYRKASSSDVRELLKKKKLQFK